MFRADGVHRLRGDDLEAARALGLRTVIDLRTDNDLFVVPRWLMEKWRLPRANLRYRTVAETVESLAERYRRAGYGAGHRVVYPSGCCTTPKGAPTRWPTGSVWHWQS